MLNAILRPFRLAKARKARDDARFRYDDAKRRRDSREVHYASEALNTAVARLLAVEMGRRA